MRALVAALVASLTVAFAAPASAQAVLIVNGSPVATTPPTTTTPPSVPADPPPARGSRVGQTLAITGGVILGAGWVAGMIIGLLGGYRSCAFAFGSCSSGFDPAWSDFRATSVIPIAGPWVQLAVKPASDDGWPAWLVADGLLQDIGAILLFVGIGLLGGDDPPPVAVMPMLSPGTAGLSALGSF